MDTAKSTWHKVETKLTAKKEKYIVDSSLLVHNTTTTVQACCILLVTGDKYRGLRWQ